MKAMLFGFVVMAAISVGAYAALQSVGYSTQEKFSGPAVRLDR